MASHIHQRRQQFSEMEWPQSDLVMIHRHTVTVGVKRLGSTTAVRLLGALTGSTRAAAAAALCYVFDGQPARIVIDASELVCGDRNGVGLLGWAADRAQESSIPLAFYGVHRHIRRLLPPSIPGHLIFDTFDAAHEAVQLEQTPDEPSWLDVLSDDIDLREALSSTADSLAHPRDSLAESTGSDDRLDGT